VTNFRPRRPVIVLAIAFMSLAGTVLSPVTAADLDKTPNGLTMRSSRLCGLGSCGWSRGRWRQTTVA
jgi:hypothetical protein